MKKSRSTQPAKVALAFFLVAAGLVFLTGCQGVSAGGSDQQHQQQASTLSLNLASLQFGTVQSGSSKNLIFTASNSGPASVSVSGVSISSKYFTLVSPSLPMTVAAGQSVPVTVAFTPNAAGNFTATVTVTSNASNTTATLSLSGTGAGSSGSQGTLGSNPSSEAFGNITVGAQQSQSFTLTNAGSGNVDISQVSITGTGFQLSGISLPLTLASSQSTTFSVTFTPQATGTVNGSVTIVSDASNSPLTVGLSATGVTPGALSASPASLSFGTVTVGSNSSLSETITNTGGSSVTISQVAASGTGFTLSGATTPVTLGAGQSTSFNVAFSPTSAASASGSVTVTSNASTSPLTIGLSGTGASPGGLSSNPTSLAFGSLTVGNNSSFLETVTNTGGSNVTISQVAISGTGYTLSGVTTPITIGAGQNTTFHVVFAPTTAGAATGSVTVTSNASNPSLTIPLSGTGVALGLLTSSPATLAFGNITVGNNSSLLETVTNSGGTSVTISQVAVSGTGFSLSGVTTPVTLGAGQSTSFHVVFAPTSAGSASGSVTVTSNASNPSLSIPLSATGVAQGLLSSSPTSLSFGTVTDGNNSSLLETVTNTGGASVTISQIAVSGTGFTLSGVTTPVTLGAGQSTSFHVVFTPTTAGSASGSVTVTSNASNPSLSIGLSGTGASPGTLSANPTSLSFGSVTDGNNSSLLETVTNTGGTSVTISQVSVTGTGFSLNGVSTPITVGAGQNTTFHVIFAPTTAGSASGSVTVTSNASNPSLSISLSGTGTAAAGQLSVSPTTLALGSVVVGTSGSGSGSLTASGASVTVSSASTNNAAFTLSGLTLPATIPSGQSVPFSVTFTPTTTGAATATLTFTSNAQNSPTTQALTGTGTAAPTYDVALSWDASTSSGISGYNIYRAVYSSSTCGSFSKINPSLNASTSYTDSVVTDGTAYCYAATAVNSSNQESAYSNVVSNIQIPAP